MEKETKLQILETAIDQAYKLLSITDTDEMGSEQVKRLLENLSSLMYTHERVKYPYTPCDFTGPAPTSEEPDAEPKGDTETTANIPASPTKTLVQVRTILSELAGKVDMPAILGKFGASKLSEIDPAKYEDLLAAAQEAAKEA